MKIDSPIRIAFFVGLILSFLCLLLFNLFTDYGSFFIRVLVFIVLSVLLLYNILNKYGLNDKRKDAILGDDIDSNLESMLDVNFKQVIL